MTKPSNNPPVLQALRLHQRSRILELEYAGQQVFRLRCEYLRAYSPSAEMSHKTVTNKRHVNIEQIEPVGNYGVQFHFSDGHHTGIYSWKYLYQLCHDEQRNWRRYLTKLRNIKGSRDAAVQILKVRDASQTQ